MVGAGIVGSAIASELLERGFSVVAIAPSSHDTASASFASGAMLGAFGEITQTHPHDKFDAETHMRVQSARMYPSWLSYIKDRTKIPITSGKGTLLISNTTCPEDRSNLQAILDACSRYDEPVESINPWECEHVKANPAFEPNRILFLPHEGYVNSHELLAALHVRCSSDPHYQRHDGEVAEISDGGKSVTISDGTNILVDHTVLASGSSVSKILAGQKLLPMEFPTVVKGKGSYVLLRTDKPAPYVVRTPNRDFACGLHLVPRGKDSVYLGATNRIELDEDFGVSPSLGELQNLLYNGSHQINTDMRKWSFISAGSGGRPSSLDGKMILGRLSETSISVATGTYRNGVLLAPRIAQIICNEIIDGDFEFSEFSPNNRRRAFSDAEKFDVIRRSFDDLLGYLLEPSGFLPYDRKAQISNFMRGLFTASTSEGPERDLVNSFNTEFQKTYHGELIPYLFEKLAGQTASNRTDHQADCP